MICMCFFFSTEDLQPKFKYRPGEMNFIWTKVLYSVTDDHLVLNALSEELSALDSNKNTSCYTHNNTHYTQIIYLHSPFSKLGVLNKIKRRIWKVKYNISGIHFLAMKNLFALEGETETSREYPI